jgi:Amt family ammonium transporter
MEEMVMLRLWKILAFTLAAGLLAAALATPALADQAAPAPDPSGGKTGGVADVYGATPGAPTDKEFESLSQAEPLAAKLADLIGHNRVAINMVWTLVCGFLVMFMQAGFAMAETGFTQAKNAGHTMAMNFMIYVKIGRAHV